MALAAYSKTTWVNGTTPALNETNLNKIEQGIYDVTAVCQANESTIGDLATTYEPIDATIAKTGSNNVFTVAQKETISAETYAATLDLDFDTSNHYSTTLTGNITISNPTNLDDGEIQEGYIILTQDATGGRTLSFGTYWTLVGTDGTDTTANKINIYKYTAISSTVILYEHIKAI